MPRLTTLPCPFRPAGCLLLVGLTLSAAHLTAEPSGESSWMLLLDNGNVVFGEITQDRDYYHVRRSDQSYHVRRARVLAVAQSLRELYIAQRRILSDTDAGGHLQLADWCLKQGMLATAAEELQVVRQLDPTHPRLPVSVNRYQVAVARLEASRRPAPSGVVQAAYEVEVPFHGPPDPDPRPSSPHS